MGGSGHGGLLVSAYAASNLAAAPREATDLADVFNPEQRSAVMRAVKSRDTAPEMKVRRAVHAMGLRYRLHRKDLPGSPDLVFPGRRLVLFVHGCFWHGHDCRRGARLPATNADYWRAKIGRNTARDKAGGKALTKMGWRHAIIWECETRDPVRLVRLLKRRIGV
jgi:DNA mismatch endonuclease (patch repair protein)